MPENHYSLPDLSRLSEQLGQHQLPAPFRLALYSERQGAAQLGEILRNFCGPTGDQQPCDRHCLEQWTDLVDLTTVSNRPQVLCCQHGRLGFAIPLPGDSNNPLCLLGGGVRERSGATPAAGIQSRDGATPPRFAQPTASREGARRIAEHVAQLLPQLLDRQEHGLSREGGGERLTAIREVAREVECAPTTGDAVALVSEALVVLFELPRLIFLLHQSGQQLAVHSTMGVDPGSFKVGSKPLQAVLTTGTERPLPLSCQDLADLLPGLQGHTALLFPLQDGPQGIGLLGVLDMDLSVDDQVLIELMVGCLAARIVALRQAEALHQERRLAARIVTMIGVLAQADNRQKLHQSLLDMAAELANATTGSLMLLDERDQKLRIAVAKGMSPPLARCMAVPLGEGIAGRVASSGAPLLVSDIECDQRVASPNRPRFRTKSFISLPMRHRERLIGVLNLADRQDGCCFTEDNLNLVQAFASQTLLMIERVNLLERVGQLEELSVTDPLTGLYNRRFLEIRLEEERNRSQRQNKPFSLIIADLDTFKIYNDVCGHLAGDKALHKAAAALRRTARDMDVVVRYGGEEFCLILPGTSKKEALFVAERLRKTIEAESFPGETNLPLGRLTISLGVASFPDDGNTLHDLFAAADLALYRAKDLGRNRCVLYDAKFVKPQPVVVNLSNRI